jgi:hypothetical protein
VKSHKNFFFSILLWYTNTLDFFYEKLCQSIDAYLGARPNKHSLLSASDTSLAPPCVYRVSIVTLWRHTITASLASASSRCSEAEGFPALSWFFFLLACPPTPHYIRFFLLVVVHQSKAPCLVGTLLFFCCSSVVCFFVGTSRSSSRPQYYTAPRLIPPWAFSRKW